MKTEKKFRAWDGKKFYYTPEFNMHFSKSGIVAGLGNGGMVFDIDNKIQQFTGLKDKNGKEIYFDSDYVQFIYEDANEQEQEEFGIIVLDLRFTLSICVKTNEGKMLSIVNADLKNIEIIGSIQEKPELIK